MYTLQRISEGWCIKDRDDKVHQNLYRTRQKAESVTEKIKSGLVKFVPYTPDTKKNLQ